MPNKSSVVGAKTVESKRKQWQSPNAASRYNPVGAQARFQITSESQSKAIKNYTVKKKKKLPDHAL